MSHLIEIGKKYPTSKNVTGFLKIYENYFKNFGGDTQIFFSKCKIAHSKRVFGKPRYVKKKISQQDLNNALKIFKNNKNESQNNIKSSMSLRINAILQQYEIYKKNTKAAQN